VMVKFLSQLSFLREFVWMGIKKVLSKGRIFPILRPKKDRNS